MAIQTLDEILAIIGKPDSERAKYVLERLPKAAKAKNCIASMLTLLGLEGADRFCYAPARGLCANKSKLAFFEGRYPIEYKTLEGAATEQEITSNPGYCADTAFPNLCKVNKGEGLKSVSEMYEDSKQKSTVTDPFSQLDEAAAWRFMKKLVSGEQVVGTLAYGLEDDPTGQSFHAAIVLKNREKIFVISKDHYSPLQVTQANASNIKDVISYSLEGLHIMAVGGQDMPAASIRNTELDEFSF